MYICAHAFIYDKVLFKGLTPVYSDYMYVADCFSIAVHKNVATTKVETYNLFPCFIFTLLYNLDCASI